MDVKNNVLKIISAIAVVLVISVISFIKIFNIKNNFDDYITESNLKNSVGSYIPESSDVFNNVDQSDFNAAQKHGITITSEIPKQEFDAELYTKRTYEMVYYFGIRNYKKISDISVSAIVQYSFLHMYNESLVDMKQKTKMVYRKCSVSEIKTQIKKHFEGSVDVTKSDLYNKQKGIFEMWEPKLNINIYSDCIVTKLKNSIYQLEILFYNNKQKDSVKDKVKVIYKKSGNNYLLANLNIEKR